MEVCPVSCIRRQEDAIYPHHQYGHCVVDPGRCTGCRACQRQCPWEAVEMLSPEPAAA